MQHVIKFVSDLRQIGGWFSPGTPITSSNKTGRHDITDMDISVQATMVIQQHLSMPVWIMIHNTLMEGDKI
jgi:hypothetical protein